VGYFTVDISCIIGVSDDEGSSKFLSFHVVFLDQFPMNKTGIGSTIDEGVFLDAALPLCDLNSIGIVKAYLFGFVARIEKRSPG